MRNQIAVLISMAFLACLPAIAQDDDESSLVKKIELLGATVQKDETLPNRPVVKVSVNGSKRFTGKHLHLLNGFKSLKQVDLVGLVFTADDIKELRQPEVLANLLMDGTENQIKEILRKQDEFGEACSSLLIAEFDQELFSPGVPSSDPRRELAAKRQANAAIALLRMGHSEKVWPLLKHSPDPRMRSYLIHRFARFGLDANLIIEQLNRQSDITIRRALVLSLGEYDEQGLPEAARTELLPRLQEIYRTDPDPGLHSAVGWLLRKWKHVEWLEQATEELSKDAVRQERLKKVEQKLAARNDRSPKWYINSQSQTMIVIPGPVEFMMGSPETEQGRGSNERQHRRRIGRSFALGATSVTLDQYRQFEKGYGVEFHPAFAHHGDLPAISINWYMGARYCNWLSQQEKLEPCYAIEGDQICVKKDCLSLSGYRFPTEAEMEYATRAGAVTSRHFGETDDLLSNYAWHQKSRQGVLEPLHSVSLLKPNDFGFFDVLGNAWTWCEEKYPDDPDGSDIIEDEEVSESIVEVEDDRVLRSGAFVNVSSVIRSAFRLRFAPSDRSSVNGFRVARTLPLAPEAGRN